MANKGGDIALDTVLAVLADKHRRLVLRYLRTSSNGVVSRQELIDYILTHGSNDYDAENVKIQLHHTLLPKLSDAEVIDYDPRSDLVRYRPHPVVEELLDHVETLDRKPVSDST